MLARPAQHDARAGCRFSWMHTKRAAKHAHAWYLGVSAPDLKEGLTAAEEGGSGSAASMHSKAADEPPTYSETTTKDKGPDF